MQWRHCQWPEIRLCDSTALIFLFIGLSTSELRSRSKKRPSPGSSKARSASHRPSSPTRSSGTASTPSLGSTCGTLAWTTTTARVTESDPTSASTRDPWESAGGPTLMTLGYRLDFWTSIGQTKLILPMFSTFNWLEFYLHCLVLGSGVHHAAKGCLKPFAC